jgi:hypothetical protein
MFLDALFHARLAFTVLGAISATCFGLAASAGGLM